MKKKHDPKSVILTIILIITYALSVVFNFSHMSIAKIHIFCELQG